MEFHQYNVNATHPPPGEVLYNFLSADHNHR